MQLITKAALLDTVADRVRATYTARGQWLPMAGGRNPKELVAQLEALPAGADEDTVAAIIGDNRFTAIICDECGADVPVAVRLGSEVHHPIDERQICTACLDRARTLIQPDS